MPVPLQSHVRNNLLFSSFLNFEVELEVSVMHVCIVTDGWCLGRHEMEG